MKINLNTHTLGSGERWLKQKGFNTETATMEEIEELSLQVTAELHLLSGNMSKVRESAPTDSMRVAAAAAATAAFQTFLTLSFSFTESQGEGQTHRRPPHPHGGEAQDRGCKEEEEGGGGDCCTDYTGGTSWGCCNWFWAAVGAIVEAGCIIFVTFLYSVYCHCYHYFVRRHQHFF